MKKQVEPIEDGKDYTYNDQTRGEFDRGRVNADEAEAASRMNDGELAKWRSQQAEERAKAERALRDRLNPDLPMKP